MEPLKNIYNKTFFSNLSISVKKVIPNFNEEEFNNKIFDKSWIQKELKERMHHIVITLKHFLSDDYDMMIREVVTIIDHLKKQGAKEQGFEWMFFPEFISQYGLEHYKTSMHALEEITQFVSCEFAVRPFIIKYPEPMMKQMLHWSDHKNKHVRRLASEGCRSRLPWAMALPMFKIDPKPVLPILENLKKDSSEYVRRSVANNLNDIAKDHPTTVIHIAKKWIGKTEETDKLVKHACRTLLKQGNKEIMTLFGFGTIEDIEINNFKVETPKVKVGEDLYFSFQLQNKKAKDLKIRLEYGLYYQKANGTLSKKVFKISEKIYAGSSTTNIKRKQSFKVISTRKYHLGLHQVALIINGVEQEKYDFQLTM